MVRFVTASVLALSLGSWAAAATPADGAAEPGGAAQPSPPAGRPQDADAAPTVVIGDMAAQPDMPLSAAATATAPIGNNIARAQPVMAPQAPPVRIGLTPPAGRPAMAEAPSAAPVVAQAPRVDGGTKVEEPAPPARVTVPAAPGPIASAAAPTRGQVLPGAQVVLVQQQPSVPGAATPSLQLAPGSTRIQVAPGQPIPPLLGGGPATPVAPALAGPIPAEPRAASVPVPVMLESGAGRLIQLPAPAAAVFAADPRVARVQPASPTSLFVMAVGAGRTNVIATGDDGQPIVEYDVTVAGRQAAGAAATPAPSFAGGAAPAAGIPRPSQVESMIRRSIRGGEGIRVAALAQRGYVLSGLAPTAADAQRAEAIAKAMGGENIEVVNSISLLSSIQVNLRVRVAEISRQVTRELGFNWAAIGGSGDWLFGLAFGGGGLLSRVLPGVPASSGDTTGRYAGRFSSGRTDINSIIDALAQDNLVSVLAEPNLTAQSGEVASFLAGGEFPVPTAGSSGGLATISVEFKQYGVGLAFVPTVLSPDRLNLRVRPEVSEISDIGSVTVPLASGVVRIPGIIVRRAETTIELGSGQSFAIAGLLSRTHRLNSSSMIGLGDIPVLGALFRSDRFRRDESELVIIATPYLVRPVSDPRALSAANDRFRPATDFERIVQRRQLRPSTGAPASQGSRAPVDAGFIVE